MLGVMRDEKFELRGLLRCQISKLDTVSFDNPVFVGKVARLDKISNRLAGKTVQIEIVIIQQDIDRGRFFFRPRFPINILERHAAHADIGDESGFCRVDREGSLHNLKTLVLAPLNGFFSGHDYLLLNCSEV